MDNAISEAIEAMQSLQSQMHNVACYLRDMGRPDKEAEMRGAADMLGQWISDIWDEAHTPRTAQQSEAVIAKALGNHLAVVKEGANRG